MLKRILDSAAIICIFVLSPIAVMAQIGPVPGSGSASSGITIATTTVTGGSTTQVLYNNAGVVGGAANLKTDGSTVTIDNGAAAVSPLIVNDNGTAVFTIADGGAVTMTNNIFNTGVETGYALGVGASNGSLANRTVNTPDTARFEVGATSNSLHINEIGDFSFDFNNGPCGTSACTYPQLITHTEAQDTTQFIGYSAVGASGGSLKTLTESSATTVFGCPAAALHAAGCRVSYRVEACDATDCQTRAGNTFISGTNKAGTMTCAVANASETTDGSTYVSSTGAGTLTYGITATTGTAECIFNLNAVASLTQTSLFVQYQVTNLGPGQVTRK